MSRKFLAFLLFPTLLIFLGASCVSFGGSKTSAGMGVYQSTDKGETWNPILAYPTVEGVKSLAGANVFRLHTDLGDPNAIFMATRGQGMFYSYNGGKSWNSFEKFAGQFIYGFAVSPTDRCTFYITNGPNIYKSVDCGRAWDLVYTEQRPNEKFIGLAVDFGNSDIVYGVNLNGDIFRSVDEGLSWQVVNRLGMQLRDVQADPLNPGRVYVASYKKGLVRSDDQGGSWTRLNEGLNEFSNGLNFYRLVLHPTQKDSLFWICKYGILRSDDAGQNWTDIKLLTPPGGVNIYAFNVSPSNENEMYYTGTILGKDNVHVRSTFYKTNDGGQNWVTKKLPTGSIPTSLLIHPENNSLLYLGFMQLAS